MDDALRNVLLQLQGQFQDAQRQLQVVSQQTQARERDKKLNTLTLREIEALPKDEGEAGATLYRGVGRMFMYEPRSEIETGLEAKIKTSTDEIAALEKKAKHYQNEMATAQGSLRDLLQQERS